MADHCSLAVPQVCFLQLVNSLFTNAELVPGMDISKPQGTHLQRRASESKTSHVFVPSSPEAFLLHEADNSPPSHSAGLSGSSSLSVIRQLKDTITGLRNDLDCYQRNRDQENDKLGQAVGASDHEAMNALLQKHNILTNTIQQTKSEIQSHAKDLVGLLENYERELGESNVPVTIKQLLQESTRLAKGDFTTNAA
jgi:hypothetical protein